MSAPAFCRACGTALPDGARFCRTCGRGVTAVPVSPPALRQWWPVAVLGAVIVAAAAAVAVLVLGRDDEVVRARRPAVATVVPPAPAEPAPADPMPADPPASVTAVTATVSGTCGSDGTADCFVSVRARPDPSAPELRRVGEGDRVRVDCQSRGAYARSSVLGEGSRVWTRTTGGGYVATVYLDGATLDATRRTLPRC